MENCVGRDEYPSDDQVSGGRWLTRTQDRSEVKLRVTSESHPWAESGPEMAVTRSGRNAPMAGREKRLREFTARSNEFPF